MSHRSPYLAIASRQYGLVTFWQLRDCGLSHRQIAHLVSSGALEPVRRSVYRVTGTAPTWMSAVLAAVLAAGDGAIASHDTAGYLWSLRHVDRPDAIHVLSGQRLRLAGVTAHRGLLTPKLITRYRRIPVTTLELTLALLAGSLGRRRLGETVDDALRRKILRLERLRSVAGHLDDLGCRNLGPLRAVLADRPRDHQVGGSEWEQSQDELWDRLGLPPSVRQYPVTVASGRRYTLDRAFPELKIGVEWDGYEFHGDRSAFDRDRDRDAEFTAIGWVLLHFTSNSAPELIARTVWGTVAVRQQPGVAPLRQQAAGDAVRRQGPVLTPAGPGASGARLP